MSMYICMNIIYYAYTYECIYTCAYMYTMHVFTHNSACEGPGSTCMGIGSKRVLSEVTHPAMTLGGEGRGIFLRNFQWGINTKY